MLQITQTGFVPLEPHRLGELRRLFDERHCVVLPQLLAPALVRRLLDRLETARFEATSHLDTAEEREFARDLTVHGADLSCHLLHLVLNNPALFRAIEHITGCQGIGSFSGRVFRLLPTVAHHLSWHDDGTTGAHLLGVSINLSPEAYSGGVFQIRDRRTLQITGEVAHTGPGDAHVFRISPGLQHRVTAVEGPGARTVCAGWFDSHPDYVTLLKAQLASPGAWEEPGSGTPASGPAK